MLEVEGEDEDPLKLSDHDVVDVKENLQLLTGDIVPEKDSPQEDRKVDSRDGSEFKVPPSS